MPARRGRIADKGAEHDPCKILAHRLFRTPGGAQNPQLPAQMRPLRTKHELVTLSVIDRVLQNESRFCGRSARILHGSCSAPVRGLLFRRPGSWDNLNVEELPMSGQWGAVRSFALCDLSWVSRSTWPTSGRVGWYFSRDRQSRGLLPQSSLPHGRGDAAAIVR